MMPALGFIGLGAMGAPMAANIAGGGFALTVYDQAGSRERAPAGTTPVESLAELAGAAQTVFLSVPAGDDSLAVVEGIAALGHSRVQTVIDLSTTGIPAAKAIHARCERAGLVYVDSPVSGGQAGARAGTITIIWAGPRDLLEQHRSALTAMSGNIFRVGGAPGQGQAVKLLNNFLSATALAATSEAMLFGLSQGIDLKTMVDVVNVSTGRNTATSDKFPKRILTGSYDAGFRSALMAKDTGLYLRSAATAGTPTAVGEVIDRIWQHANEAMPDGDITRIFQLLQEDET